MSLLEVQHLSLSIDKKEILHSLSVTANQGEFIGLIGPNGSGKSTLLRTLANLSSPSSGKRLFAGQPYESYSRKELACLISYVPQDTHLEFDFSVKDIVSMGRYPHRSRFQGEREADRQQIIQAMELTNTAQHARQAVSRLSGGQRQLVFIAKALAQQPVLMLLDEPISALDIRHQLQVLSLIKQLTASGLTVIASLHDLNLAARYCDRLMLLKEGQLLDTGLPEEVLTQDAIYQAYEIHAEITYDHRLNCPVITPFHEEEPKYAHY